MGNFERQQVFTFGAGKQRAPDIWPPPKSWPADGTITSSSSFPTSPNYRRQFDEQRPDEKCQESLTALTINIIQQNSNGAQQPANNNKMDNFLDGKQQQQPDNCRQSAASDQRRPPRTTSACRMGRALASGRQLRSLARCVGRKLTRACFLLVLLLD